MRLTPAHLLALLAGCIAPIYCITVPSIHEVYCDSPLPVYERCLPHSPTVGDRDTASTAIHLRATLTRPRRVVGSVFVAQPASKQAVEFM